MTEQTGRCGICQSLGVYMALLENVAVDMSAQHVLTEHETGDETGDTVQPNATNCHIYSVLRGILQISDGTLANARLISSHRGSGINVASVDQLHGRLYTQPNHILFNAVSRIFRMRVPEKVSKLFVLRQLVECKVLHNNCRARNQQLERLHSEGGTTNFRIILIDVKKKKLIRATVDKKYVALSYCWGSVSHFRLQTREKNVPALMQDGALTNPTPPLPRTVQNAIQFVNELRLRYLWVDALCIVQDDEVEKPVQINSMDLIYSRAIFTLVAMDGDSSDYGLPGVQPHSRPLRCHQLATKHVVAEKLQFQAIYNNSAWSTRGWTYQESILSKRLVYFSKWGVWYQCLTTFKSDNGKVGDNHEEGMYSKVGMALNPIYMIVPAMARMNRSTSLSKYFFEGWTKLVEDYSGRQLRQVDDRVNALSGINSQFMARIGSDRGCFFGIPWIFFNYGIMWTLKDQESEIFRRKEFPSWAWAGWEGACEYQFALSMRYGYPEDEWSRSTILTSQVIERGRLQFSTDSIDCTDFLLSTNATLARTTNFGYYSSVYHQTSLCGFLLGCTREGELPEMSKFIALTTRRIPTRENNVHDSYRGTLRWAREVGQANTAVLVVLLVQDGKENMERLGIGVMFWNNWQKFHRTTRDILLA